MLRNTGVNQLGSLVALNCHSRVGWTESYRQTLVNTVFSEVRVCIF